MKTKRDPLLSDQLMKDARCFSDDCLWVRGHYEAARAKDAELIQQLVDALHKCTVEQPSEDGAFVFATIDAAASAGFTPTETH